MRGPIVVTTACYRTIPPGGSARLTSSREVARAARLVAADRAGGYFRTGHVEPSYLWPAQAFADWAESHSAPGLTRSW